MLKTYAKNKTRYHVLSIKHLQIRKLQVGRSKILIKECRQTRVYYVNQSKNIQRSSKMMSLPFATIEKASANTITIMVQLLQVETYKNKNNL